MALYSYKAFNTLVYYNLSKHIYLTKINNDYIFLDIKKDLYFVCNPACLCLVDKIVSSESFYIDKGDYFLNLLLSLDLVRLGNSPRVVLFDNKQNITEVARIDWTLNTSLKVIDFGKGFFRSFLTLVLVHFYMSFRGFDYTIEMIRKQTTKKNFFLPSSQDLDNLASIVNQSCLYFPMRTKCLEWAITFVMLALKKGWKCNLEIGVQNYPFYAHAWVECNGKVICDEPDLRDKLAIILREPFK